MTRALRSRTAFTLYELVVTIGVTTMIAGMATTLLHAMLRQQSAATIQLSLGNSMMRMSNRFSRDVNAANKADVTEDEISLSQPNGISITWQPKDHMMVRTWESNGEARNDYFDFSAEHRHSFIRRAIAEGTELIGIKLVKMEDQDADTFSEDAVPRDPRQVTANRPSKIWAELGRDHRWSSKVPELEVRSKQEVP